VRPLTVLAALAALALLRPAPLDACAVAPPPNALVEIVDEEALIVWDAPNQVEHFVRRASFRTEASQFGFIVPTPTKPELAEAPDAVFRALAEAVAPKVVQVHETVFEPVTMCCLFWTMGATEMSKSDDRMLTPVRVLDETRVAGYDAAILEADDAKALAQWLQDHGYESRPALAEWLEPYVRGHWKLTAFKLSKDAKGQRERDLASKNVRLSFKTEKPFFPYREPRDQKEHATYGRSLRVFLVADRRMEGSVGLEGRRWPEGVTKYAGPLPAVDVAACVPAGALPKGAWLTALVDQSSPRPGDDEVYFVPEASGKELIPPPVQWPVHDRVPVPVDIVWIGALVGVFVWWRRRRKRGPLDGRKKLTSS